MHLCPEWLFDGEVFADGAVSGADAAGVVLIVPLVNHGVELVE